eukprot:scaffold297132_cov19-Tisochrysis_lutea.AAC.4
MAGTCKPACTAILSLCLPGKKIQLKAWLRESRLSLQGTYSSHSQSAMQNDSVADRGRTQPPVPENQSCCRVPQNAHPRAWCAEVP